MPRRGKSTFPPPKRLIFFEYQAFLQLFFVFLLLRKIGVFEHLCGRIFLKNVCVILGKVLRENLRKLA